MAVWPCVKLCVLLYSIGAFPAIQLDLIVMCYKYIKRLSALALQPNWDSHGDTKLWDTFFNGWNKRPVAHTIVAFFPG